MSFTEDDYEGRRKKTGKGKKKSSDITFFFNASSPKSLVAQLLCSTRVAQRAHIASRPQVVVDLIVLVVVLPEDPLSLVVEVAASGDFAVETGRDVISMLFELRLNVQEAKILYELVNWRFFFLKKKAHRLFFYSLSDALNYILDNGDVVTVRFIISKPHHSPSRQHRIPMNLDDAVINLFSRFLEPNTEAPKTVKN